MSTGPRNPAEMTLVVAPGDSVPSFAFEQGRFWEGVWNHPNNAALRELRKNPNILCEGDTVYIPALRQKDVTVPTGARHKFRVRGVPSVLRVVLVAPPDWMDDPFARMRGETKQVERRPWANVPYRLEVDGRASEGKADADGVVRVTIPPNARDARIVVAPGTEEEQVHALVIGEIHPIDDPRGGGERLRNIGYPFDAADPTGPSFVAAVRQFQLDEELPVTGVIDDATKARLAERHGT